MLSNVTLPIQLDARNVTHKMVSNIKLSSALVRIAFQLCTDSFAPARSPLLLDEQIRQPTNRITGIAQKLKASIVAAREMKLSNNFGRGPLPNTPIFASNESSSRCISNID